VLSIASMMADKSLCQETLERFHDAFEADDATTSELPHVRARLQLENLCSVPLDQSHFPMLESLAATILSQKPLDAESRQAIGLMHLRTGEFEKATESLRDTAQEVGLGESRDAYGLLGSRWAALALAYHHADKDVEARRWLDQCDRWIDESRLRRTQWLAGDIDAGAFFDDMYHLTAYAMIREAKLEIEGELPDGFPLHEPAEESDGFASDHVQP
jgi:hypothetical protein